MDWLCCSLFQRSFTVSFHSPLAPSNPATLPASFPTLFSCFRCSTLPSLALQQTFFGSPINHLPSSFPPARHLPVSDGRTCPAVYTRSLPNCASSPAGLAGKTLLTDFTLPTAAFSSTRPHFPDFLTESTQPFASFGSKTPCLSGLVRILHCGWLLLALQPVPAHTMSSLRSVQCCSPLWFY